MNIRIFNRKYWVRRFGEQKTVGGYLVSGYKDCVVSLHVHPLGSEQVIALPEGERKVRRLEAHGDGIELVAADEKQNRKGDLLYYNGEWYECVAADRWDHTLLSHTNYQFVQVPKDASGSTDTAKPPTGDASEWKGGE